MSEEQAFETRLNRNTKDVGFKTIAKLLGVDAFAAASASFLVSPFIAIVDRAIIENANGKSLLGEGLKKGFKTFFTRPDTFIMSRQFRLVYFLYFSTYASANTIDTVFEHIGKDSQSAKFIGTTATNMSICIYKDRCFTRMFGAIAAKPLPALSYALFATRDSLTIAASFNAPATMSKKLVESGSIENKKKADMIAQLVCPAVVQFVSTPLHLLGLDMYNRVGMSAGQRASFISKTYIKTVAARIARIGPAFGFGGIGNNWFREMRIKVLETDRNTIQL